MSKPRRFRMALLPSLIAAILLPLFLYLGYWQLQRAQEKRVLQAQYDARADNGLIQVEPRVQTAAALQFYRVVARGYYEPGRQIFLDNRVHLGQAGYEVITPLHLQNSDVRLLVNRGWIPLGEDRGHLPVIATPQGLQEVTGVATVPAEKVFTLAKSESLGGAWQTVWQYLELARYRQAVPYPIQPVVVLLDPENPAGGFTRAWSRLDTGIAVHQGYAFQWFMLAGALIAIYLFMSLRREGETKLKEHRE